MPQSFVSLAETSWDDLRSIQCLVGPDRRRWLFVEAVVDFCRFAEKADFSELDMLTSVKCAGRGSRVDAMWKDCDHGSLR